MTHHHLGFHSPYRFKRNAYNDKYRSTAHCDVDARDLAEDYREDRDYSEEDSAHEGDLGKDPAEVIAGRLTGSDAGDAAV